MSEFKTFRGIYKNAQALEDIASQTGIKSGVKDQIRASADAIRELADQMEGDITTLEACGCCDQVGPSE